MKFLTNIDLSKNQLLNASLQKLATAPSSPTTGQVYYNTADNKAYIYNGTSWVDLTQQDTNTVTRIKGGTSGTLVSGDINLLAGSNITISQSANDITITGVSGSLAFTGDVTGSGTTGGSTALTLAASGVTAGTYKSVTVDSKGRVTAGTNPTTLSGYGITDAQPLDADLTAIAALTGISGFLKTNGAGTWSVDTSTYLTGNQTITVSGDATGSGTTAITLTLSNSGVAAGTYNSVTVDSKGRVTSGSNPTTLSGYGITDAYTKTEVDSLITGLEFKQSVRAISTSNITLSGTQTIDGVALSAGDRVLVSGQTTASQNGIYVVAAGAWTRATDFDNTPGTEVSTGSYVYVDQGTVYANSGWVLSTVGAITIGTTALTFVQFNGLAQVTAGTGLTKNGNTLSANISGTTQTTAANALTTTASRTYAIQPLASGQLVVNIPWTDTVYTLPTASTTTFGGVKIGDSTVQSTAANVVSSTASRTYAVQFNSSNQLVVNVPWVDTDTVYTHPTYTYTSSADTVTTLSSIPLVSTLTVNSTGHTTASTFRKLVAGSNITLTPASDGNITIASTGAAKYTTDIGDGTNTSYTLTHGLGTSDISVSVYLKSTGEQVFTDVTVSSTQIVVSFASAPSLNLYRVVAIG